MASTPPPQSSRTRARTPPGPRHGAEYDNYEPYSPRRSTRSTAQNNPYASHNTSHSPKAARTTTPPPTIKRTRFARAPTQLTSPPSSPASPVRHRTPRQTHKTPRKVLFSEQRKHVNAGATLSDSDGPVNASLAPTTTDNAMYPTPSRTPKKRHSAVNSTARILNFQQPANPNDVMPSPRQLQKERRKNNSNTMAGFELYEDEPENQIGGDISIYMDTNARVPEMDESEDNPFVGPRKTTRPQRRTRKTAEEIERDAQVEEAARQDSGVIYVFRGKKIFRRFADPTANSDHDQASSTAGSEVSGTPEQRQLKRQAGAAARRPLTRSAIKPRLLFPSEDQQTLPLGPDDVDEEAVTDIEMGNAADLPAQVEQTPIKAQQQVDMATPPPTMATRGRSMRSAKRAAAQSPPAQLTPVVESDTADGAAEGMNIAIDSSFGSASSALAGKHGKGKKASPFDLWPRGKAGKRRAEDAVVGASGGGGGKRMRGGVVGSPA